MSREDGHGLLCPSCGSGALFVKDTRSTSGYIRRRRQCKDCSYRGTSYEVIEQIGDPAGTKISDILQLREQMMKLAPDARVLIRRLIVKLTEAGTKSPSEPANLGPLTPPESVSTPDRVRDDCPGDIPEEPLP